MRDRRWHLLLSLALALALNVFTGALASTPAAAASSAYVMAYFTESPNGNGSNYGLHLAVSTDSLKWTPLNQNAPVVTPTAGTGGLRDPFVLRRQDGTLTVLATDLNGTDWTQANQYIHVWNTNGLTGFSDYHRLKLHDMDTHSWAPEAFWDASRSAYAIIYSAVYGGHNVIMVDYTTDFVTVSAPQVFFDPGYDVIDADVAVGVNGVNYLYFKSSSAQALVGARSTSLDPGSFSIYTAGVAHGGTEAPILVKDPTGNGYYLWGDTYTPNGVFYAWHTTDLSTDSWTAVDQRAYTQPLNSKHASIQPISTAEYNTLVSTWGTPTWNRLKSYNYPARYVRHSNFVGRIDAYPFDPYLDSEWKIVAGLADSSGVSFESVNYPGRYLRHYNYAIQLDTDDGTTTFAQDATFYKVSGLADSSYSSFRSYNNPTYYLRHSNYVLRIDPVSTATDRSDATFQVGY
ncbi:glycoside hydrolase family 43 protein [Streptomyces sp. NPDC059373]